jgi:flagellar hook-basal body complex protein FliE
MTLGEITSNINGLSTPKSFENQGESKGATFADILTKSLQEVNSTQVDGYKAMESIATGKVENLQAAVQKIEEAELSLKLALEVKNKALSAYKEIIKMQV